MRHVVARVVTSWWKRALAIAFALALAGLVSAPWALGLRHYETHEVARPASAEALETEWDALLEGAVQDGRVDYGVLSDRRGALLAFVSALAVYGPETAPEVFESEEARFAYYINAYNAFVVHAVVSAGVRRSVHEVRGPIEPTEGFGFFWSQRFELDGHWVSLHGLENDILRVRFPDARLHAAINCASVSCPALAPIAYHAARLDDELAHAAQRFTEAPHVQVDETAQTVTLSAIYTWYAEDFATHARALGVQGDALSWIAQHSAEPGVAQTARRDGYTIRFAEYDWGLNGSW